MPIMSEPAVICLEEYDEVGDVGFSTPQPVEDLSTATTSLGGSRHTDTISCLALGWQLTLGYNAYTPHTSLNMGSPSVAWPYANPHCSALGMPYSVAPPQAQAKNLPGTGYWPFPAVANTGYNTLPIGPLPHGDYSMPLGDHLTSTTKEKI